MADPNDLLPRILPEVPGCPSAIVLNKLSETLRHFCRESWLWQVNIDPITLLELNSAIPQLNTYQMSAGPNIEVLGVVDLYYKGQVLRSATESVLNDTRPGWNVELATQPQLYIPKAGGHVMFVPGSDSVQPVVVTGIVAAAPTYGAPFYGDDLTVYDEGIVAGTLAALQRMAKKEWSDPQLSVTNQAIYADSLSLAKLEALREHQADAPMVTPMFNI